MNTGNSMKKWFGESFGIYTSENQDARWLPMNSGDSYSQTGSKMCFLLYSSGTKHQMVTLYKKGCIEKVST